MARQMHIWHVRFCAGLLNSSDSFYNLSLHSLSLYTVSKLKMFSYFSCWPKNVMLSLKMTWRCLKYILNLRQKLCIGNFFLTYFLDKLTWDCNSENTIFPAQIMVNFKMGGKKTKQNTKNQPQTSVCSYCEYLVSVMCKALAVTQPWNKCTQTKGALNDMKWNCRKLC